MSLKEVRERFLELEDSEGCLDPRIALADARDPASPLHSHLEWDDAVAGEGFRLQQIESLARRVKYVFTIKKGEVRTVQYVRNPTLHIRESGYVNIQRVTRKGQRLAVIGAEVERVLALYRRGHKIALSFGMESEFEDAVMQGLSDSLG